MSESKKLQTTESVVENLTVVIKNNLKEFKEKQVLLVKENPFIEITDLKTYEAAKKSRTSLVSGRTALQKQLTIVNAKLNPVKTFVKTEIDALIEVSKPAEDKQQTEVKRFETIKETERIAREKIAEEKKQEIQGMIDEIISDFTSEIKSLEFENMITFQSNMEQHFDEIDTSKFEDLEIYFSGKVASLKITLETKINELIKDQELLVSQSENRFQQFKTKWMERFMNANINNIQQLNLDFDTEVPEIDAETFFTFKDAFIEEINKFRDKLIDITNHCKLQQEKADEEIRIEGVKNQIKSLFDELKTTVNGITYETIIPASDNLSISIDEIRKNKDYDEFKDSIELNISNIENLTLSKQMKLVEKKVEFEETEKVRIAKEKEDEKIKKASDKKEIAIEKKRQKELKPLKDEVINYIEYFKPEVKTFITKNKEVDKIILEFYSEIEELQEKYINQIKNL